MARGKRLESSTGVYHVMLRGINRATVFKKSIDIYMFLTILAEVKAIFGFKLYGYVFMGNHVHLLLKEPERLLLSKFMQTLLTKYVRWYNIAHERCGSLFQSRFKSKPVENVAYFQRVLRYIHRNPVKSKMCRHVWQYKDSSYRSYIDDDPGIIDRDEVFDNYIPKEEFEVYNDSEELEYHRDDYLYMIDELPFRLTEQMARRIMKNITKLDDLESFSSKDKDFIVRTTRELRKRGLSYGQISRAISKSKGTVFRWDKSALAND